MDIKSCLLETVQAGHGKSVQRMAASHEAYHSFAIKFKANALL